MVENKVDIALGTWGTRITLLKDQGLTNHELIAFVSCDYTCDTGTTVKLFIGHTSFQPK
jgi:hypothetical protein